MNLKWKLKSIIATHKVNFNSYFRAISCTSKNCKFFLLGNGNNIFNDPKVENQNPESSPNGITSAYDPFFAVSKSTRRNPNNFVTFSPNVVDVQLVKSIQINNNGADGQIEVKKTK